MIQLITPNPDIACEPGWCLQYVRQAFGLPGKYGSATEAWEKSTSQHRDRNFPSGVWHPVWYGLVNEPLGHVVLRAPDGSVYSTSDLGNTPHHHPDLADLEAFYAYYGMTLTYRGWTEDVASYPVITKGVLMALTDNEQDELLAGVRLLMARTADIKTAAGPKSVRQMIADGTRAAQNAAANTAGITVTGGKVQSLRQFIADGTRAAQNAVELLKGKPDA
jgi:hypothetical protein